MGPSRPTAISTEHNADCYSAFLWRGRLEGNQRYLTVANEVRAFMLPSVVGRPDQSLASNGHFRVGIGAGGIYLDAQTWTSLALGEDLRDARFELALPIGGAAAARQHRSPWRSSKISSASTNPTTRSRRKCGPRAAKEWSPRCWPSATRRARTAITPRPPDIKASLAASRIDREPHRLDNGAVSGCDGLVCPEQPGAATQPVQSWLPIDPLNRLS